MLATPNADRALAPSPHSGGSQTLSEAPGGGELVLSDPLAIPDAAAHDELAAFLGDLAMARLARSIAAQPGPAHGPYPAATFNALYDANAYHLARAYAETHGGWVRTRRPAWDDDQREVIYEVLGCNPASVRPVPPPAPRPVVGHVDGIYSYFGVPAPKRPSLDVVNAEIVVANAERVL
jgi:hypothetical protein